MFVYTLDDMFAVLMLIVAIVAYAILWVYGKITGKDD